MLPVVLTFLLALSSTLGLPANGDQLDKATIDDVSVNSVTADKKIEQTQSPAVPSNAQSVSTVQISGLQPGYNPTPTPAVENPTPRPSPGSAFARIIDDIFQIPIKVLQNVARLITNPFTKRAPEIVATVP